MNRVVQAQFSTFRTVGGPADARARTGFGTLRMDDVAVSPIATSYSDWVVHEGTVGMDAETSIVVGCYSSPTPCDLTVILAWIDPSVAPQPPVSNGVYGTNIVNPPGTNMLRFGRVTVGFGKPMDFSRFDGLAGNRFIERAVTDEVVYELMGLSGQEYVDIYAASLKKGGSGDAANGEPARIPETAAG